VSGIVAHFAVQQGECETTVDAAGHMVEISATMKIRR
jgi:hypothetical protein